MEQKPTTTTSSGIALASRFSSDLQMIGRIDRAAEWSDLCVERWHFDPGPRPDVCFDRTVVAILLSGRAGVRRDGIGPGERLAARPGLIWVCPAGTQDRNVEFVGPMDVLHLSLPDPMLTLRVMEDREIDPSGIELAFAQGVSDPTLLQIGMSLEDIVWRGAGAAARLLIDGLRMALVGHLLGNYAVHRSRPSRALPVLDAKRLARVVDAIEARLGEDLGLEDLAAEACLSAYHFSRLFREAMGVPPHRYLTGRRVQAAKEKLRLQHSTLAEIALDTGFGSQANFIRVFRKVTGVTPGQYRTLHVTRRTPTTTVFGKPTK